MTKQTDHLRIHRLFITIALIILASLKVATTAAYGNDNENTPDIINIPLTNHSVPLIAKSNSHHVNVYVGSPPQRRLVIVDTGSRYLAFPCKPCRSCGIKHFSKEYFDPEYSTTDLNNQCYDGHGHGLGHINECVFHQESHGNNCENDKCTFSQHFQEGSALQGFEVEDIVWLGTDNVEQSIKCHMQTAVPLSFGCESHETGIVASQYADGIMGLISYQQENIVDVMYKSGVISNHAFSLCFTKDGGVFSLGGTSLVKHHMEPMQMEPLISSLYYTVSVKAFHVGVIEIGMETPGLVANAFNIRKGTIIDSGTTDTYLPLSLKNEFEKAWTDLSNGGNKRHSNKIQSFTFEQFQLLPNVTIVLSGGYRWVIEPHAYMDEITPKRDTGDFVDTRNGWSGVARFVNRLYIDEQGGAVMGSNAMVGHDVLFDIKHRTVGIAKANCR